MLIHFEDEDTSKRGLVVWDPVTGSQQHLSVPSAGYPSYSFHSYTGAVLCAKDVCDHLDCHDGPFRMVFVETNLLSPIFACATKLLITNRCVERSHAQSYHLQRQLLPLQRRSQT